MQRLLKALPIALVAAAMCPAAASAGYAIIGQTKTKLVAPSCPSTLPAGDCTIVLNWATALPSISDGIKSPTTITKPGKIVSFTVGISNLSKNKKTRQTYITDLDASYGGSPEARVTILRPVGRAAAQSYRVISESGVWNLKPFLGKVKRLQLGTGLPVVPGDVVALTVPTWAPVLPLATNPKQFAYKQARGQKCSHSDLTSNINVQSTVGEFAKYACTYGTRPQFTAGERTSS
jgi:hypothetical protein